MGRQISLYNAKTHFSDIIERVAAGSEYVVTRNGVPCARVVPFRKPKKVPLGFAKGTISERFFDPLPEEELAAWEGQSNYLRTPSPGVLRAPAAPGLSTPAPVRRAKRSRRR